MAQYLVPFGILLLSNVILCTDNWSYEGDRGPLYWPKTFQTCVGNQQSPINIDERNVKDIVLPVLKFSGLSKLRSSFLSNNGHTVTLRTNGSTPAMVTGGPLDNKIYVLEQMHVHWGPKDTMGSEHLVNNHSSAMELHAVFYKKDYGSMDAALNHSDGLTVLAYFYEASETSNPAFEAIVDVLPSVEMAGSSNVLEEPLILDKLLVPSVYTIQHYFTYSGSLTTPPCFEVVTWINFKEPQFLSREQLAAFRSIRSLDGNKLTHNFRPVQPLSDRIVFRNAPFNNEPNDLPPDQHHHHDHANNHTKDPHSGQIGIHLSVVVLLAALLLAI